MRGYTPVPPTDALIDTAIRNAKPTDKIRKLTDGKRMFLAVFPNGAKRWRLKYRFGGRAKSPDPICWPESLTNLPDDLSKGP
jgi:hypothetical protein